MSRQVRLSPADRDRILQGKAVRLKDARGRKIRLRKPVPLPWLIRAFAAIALLLIALIGLLCLFGCGPREPVPVEITFPVLKAAPIIEGGAVVVQELEDGLHLRLIREGEAFEPFPGGDGSVHYEPDPGS